MYSCTLKGSMTFSSFCARYFEKGEISKTPHLKKTCPKNKLWKRFIDRFEDVWDT